MSPEQLRFRPSSHNESAKQMFSANWKSVKCITYPIQNNVLKFPLIFCQLK